MRKSDRMGFKSIWGHFSQNTRSLMTGIFKIKSLGLRLLVALFLLLALAFFIYLRGVHFAVVETDLVESKKGNQAYSGGFQGEFKEGLPLPEQIGIIYQLNLEAIKTKRFEISQRLAQDRKWRLFFPSTTFEEINRIEEMLFSVLRNARFTDPSTLRQLKLLKTSKSIYAPLPTSFDGSVAIFPENFWESVKNQAIEKGNHPLLIDYIIDYFRKIPYPFEQDFSSRVTWDGFFRGMGKNGGGNGLTARVTLHKSMQEVVSKQEDLSRPLSLFSGVIFAIIILFLGWLYLRMHHKQILQSAQKLSLYATIIILTLLLSKMVDFFLPHYTDLFEAIRYPLYVPFAAILIAILLSNELAFFSVFVLTVVLGLFLVEDTNRFLVSNFTAGIVAVLSCKTLRKRKEVFGICTKVWVASVLIFFAYNLTSDKFWGLSTLIDSSIAAAYLLLTSILIISFLPILESIFAIMTDITLMEYMDPNNELLRRLSLEAPGTYQHCLVVGSLAEAAAQAVGANGFFCRVSTLYHDIGKLFNPHYFTENQMGGFNIHQLLTPLESAQVIIDHVKEGETLARKHRLPQSFIDIIKEHHGHTLVYYFYAKQLEQAGGDKEAVDEDQFRYPGPDPTSKESAIIMMADTVEAASRSLETVSEESLAELVERLIGEKLIDGQFRHCELNFKEFETIKNTIVKTLAVARHLRIKYPEKKG